jgi:serine protease
MIRRTAALLVVLASWSAGPIARAAATAPYRPGEVIVAYTPSPVAVAAVAVAHAFGASDAAAPIGTGPPRLVHLRRGESVSQAIAHLTRQSGVAYAVPNYLAHITGSPPSTWTPDDPGRTHQPAGWERLQWNFLPGAGVDAPAAWANLRADGRPGGRGVVVAVLDTGVAYRNWRHFRQSPDFADTRFADPYDFVAGDAYPLDRQGHGTFVAGTIAESTNNGFGLTGIAYGATIMPVRVLDGGGWGDADTIARGIRYAVSHGAQVINLSLEFDPSVTAGQIPSIISAVDYAHSHGVVLVAASGNESENRMAYPARSHQVISVGATTRDRCLAAYSNGGHGLDLVAPGGGDDSTLPGDPDCHPDRSLPDIFQMTFGNPAHPDRFGYPNGWYGTSMAAPHVAAVAALVIASGVLGHDPSPDQVLARLEATAQPLGQGRPNAEYGYGLIDAGAATAR